LSRAAEESKGVYATFWGVAAGFTARVFSVLTLNKFLRRRRRRRSLGGSQRAGSCNRAASYQIAAGSYHMAGSQLDDDGGAHSKQVESFESF
jgi:hypothetical protein